MNRVFFVALLFAFLCCVFAVPAYAQLGLCAQCHNTTFLQNMTAGNAYNCNYGGQTGLSQCGWVPLVTLMQSNAANSPVPVIWTPTQVTNLISYLETSLPVATPAVSFPQGTAGVAYTPATLTGSTTPGDVENPPGQIPGGTAPFTWHATSGLPSGMALSTAGVLSGTPPIGSQGTYTVQITIQDSANPATPIVLTTRTLTIAPPALSITGPASLSTGTGGVAYSSVTFTATGGTGTGYTWSATGLPAGMSINASTGVLGGTPTAVGVFAPQFTVKDSSNATASVSRSLTINPPVGQLFITGPGTLPAGTVGATYGPVTFTANGGAGGYIWSASGLPNGLSINPSTGVLSGIPGSGSQGAYSPFFTVKDSNNVTASQGLGLTINPASLVNPFGAGGQSISASGGSGTIPLSFPAGFSWTASTASNWIIFTGPASGVGSGALSYQVTANAGGDRSGSITVAGYSFAIQQEGSIPGLSFAGSMAHLAAEENWTTTFTLVNKSVTSATARLSFFGDAVDPTGNGPLTVPVAFPQQTGLTGPLLAASFDQPLAANASLIVSSAGAQTPPVLVGSAQLAATTGAVDGFGIFHQIATTQEAVVPMETRNASSYLLAFDNTSGLVLGVAVENLAAQNAVIPVIIRNDAGVVISTPGTTISLGANGHTSFVLSDLAVGFPVTANIRGTIEFDTPSGGRIGVLGLRFTPPNNALTTIPALANVGTGGGSIAHLASGGDGWQTTFVLVNTGTSASQMTLNFFADQTGAPLSLPLSFPQSGGGNATVASSVTQTLGAGATLLIVSDGAPQLLTGSAQLTTPGNISGFVIFRHNGQEAVVPLESRNANGYIIAFDNTNGTATGIALNAVSTQAVNVPVVVRNDAGTQIVTDTIALTPNGHTQFTLVTDKYPGTANVRGTIEFDKPATGQIGALGIRIPTGTAHTYTTLPALAK